MAYSKIQIDSSYNTTPNPWQLKCIFRALPQDRSIEVLKQCKLHYREYPFSSEFFTCVNDNLKAILDSNAILKSDDLLFTNGLISH